MLVLIKIETLIVFDQNITLKHEGSTCFVFCSAWD